MNTVVDLLGLPDMVTVTLVSVAAGDACVILETTVSTEVTAQYALYREIAVDTSGEFLLTVPPQYADQHEAIMDVASAVDAQ